MTKDRGDTPSGSGLAPASQVEPASAVSSTAAIPIASAVRKIAFAYKGDVSIVTGLTTDRIWAYTRADSPVVTLAIIGEEGDRRLFMGAAEALAIAGHLTKAAEEAQAIEARRVETPQAAPSETRARSAKRMRPKGAVS